MRLLLPAALAAVVTSCTPAVAQVCGNPVDIARQLAAEYREAPTARGVDAGGRLVTVYSNPETGTWTVVLLAPGGCAMVAASGEGWGGGHRLCPAAGARPAVLT